MNFIIDKIYVSDAECAKSVDLLRKNQIRHILAIGVDHSDGEALVDRPNFENQTYDCERKNFYDVSDKDNDKDNDNDNDNDPLRSGPLNTGSLDGGIYNKYFQDSLTLSKSTLSDGPQHDIMSFEIMENNAEENRSFKLQMPTNCEISPTHMAITDSIKKARSKNSISASDFSTTPTIKSALKAFERDGIHYLCFPYLLDTPETSIAHIFKSTNSFITTATEVFNENVLIHCVHGQSRSVAVILAYLLHKNVKLSTSLDIIKSKRESCNINPGFLSQLSFLSGKFKNIVLFISHQHDNNMLSFLPVFSMDSPEFDLFTYKEADELQDGNYLDCHSSDHTIGSKRKESSMETEGVSTDERNIICKSCKNPLASSRDQLSGVSVVTLIEEFVEKHIDPFWEGYISPDSNKSSRKNVKIIPVTGKLVVRPIDWIKEQINFESNRYFDQGDLECPNCRLPCGNWQKKSLNLLGQYNLCDLITLDETAIRVKRRTRLRVDLDKIKQQN